MSLLASFIIIAIVGYACCHCVVHIAGVCRRRRPCVVRGEPKPVLYGSKA